MRLKAEVEVLQSALCRAEGGWSAPSTLQHWLQVTYEIESRYFNNKRQEAETRLLQAQDAVSIHSNVLFF